MLQYIRNIQKRRTSDESGASAVEYGLLVALIAAVIVVAVLALGNTVKKVFEDTGTCISNKSSC